MMLLLVSTVDPHKTVGPVLKLGKLAEEYLVGLFELCESAF